MAKDKIKGIVMALLRCGKDLYAKLVGYRICCGEYHGDEKLYITFKLTAEKTQYSFIDLITSLLSLDVEPILTEKEVIDSDKVIIRFSRPLEKDEFVYRLCSSVTAGYDVYIKAFLDPKSKKVVNYSAEIIVKIEDTDAKEIESSLHNDIIWYF